MCIVIKNFEVLVENNDVDNVKVVFVVVFKKLDKVV